MRADSASTHRVSHPMARTGVLLLSFEIRLRSDQAFSAEIHLAGLRHRAPEEGSASRIHRLPPLRAGAGPGKAFKITCRRRRVAHSRSSLSGAYRRHALATTHGGLAAHQRGHSQEHSPNHIKHERRRRVHVLQTCRYAWVVDGVPQSETCPHPTSTMRHITSRPRCLDSHFARLCGVHGGGHRPRAAKRSRKRE